MLGNFISRNKYTSFGVMKNTIIKVVFKLHYFKTDSQREGTGFSNYRIYKQLKCPKIFDSSFIKIAVQKRFLRR